MLVNKKQEWLAQPETTVQPEKVEVSKVNVALRQKCGKIALLFICFAVLLTIQSEFTVRYGYQIAQVRSEIRKLDKENEQLKLEIAKLRSPQRIQFIAASKLGMIAPQNFFGGTAGKKTN